MAQMTIRLPTMVKREMAPRMMAIRMPRLRLSESEASRLSKSVESSPPTPPSSNSSELSFKSSTEEAARLSGESRW